MTMTMDTTGVETPANSQKPAGPTGPVWDRAKRERNWLVYRLEAKVNGKPGKMIKRPVDAGTGGKVGPDAAAKLTFGEAANECNKHNTHYGFEANEPGAWGLGYLPRPGSAMVGGDIDEVKDDQGELHGWVRELIADPETYVEWSPSQNGFRVLMERQAGDEVINGTERNGVGLFADGKKFFTITGQRIGTTGEITGASGLRERLFQRRDSGSEGADNHEGPHAPSSSPTAASGVPSGAKAPLRGRWHGIPPERRAAALRDALSYISYEDRDHWVKISAAVHSTIPDLGEDVVRPIWDAWCDGIGGPTDENEKAWDSFTVDRSGGSSVSTVFAEAKKRGWNEAKHVFGILTEAEVAAQVGTDTLEYSKRQAKRQKKSKNHSNRHDNIDGLVRDLRERPLFNVSNVMVLMESHNDLRSTFVFDEFQQKVMVTRAVPGQRRKEVFPRPLVDSDYTAVQGWFQKNGFPTATKQPVIDAIEAIDPPHLSGPI